MNEPLPDDTVAGHLQELRRGTVVLACLARLERPDYGYALLESLDAAGILVDANTLYPLLRRLEKQRLLTSEWNTDEARPRKFYRTSAAGAELAERLLAEWRRLDDAVTALAAAETASSQAADQAADSAEPASDTAPADPESVDPAERTER
ncbi:PadR family transcriptional regulator [Agromyces sp. MMS17-SY077]|uniref:PadR family transcriptional regulator n=1 Tax=Agromyces seonyuensis TaxID=2662446 RepID=A0A6I4P2X4_9MICO|nr:PadR family transcriptional regulator [Agromyces seonyuensis]